MLKMHPHPGSNPRPFAWEANALTIIPASPLIGRRIVSQMLIIDLFFRKEEKMADIRDSTETGSQLGVEGGGVYSTPSDTGVVH